MKKLKNKKSILSKVAMASAVAFCLFFLPKDVQAANVSSMDALKSTIESASPGGTVNVTLSKDMTFTKRLRKSDKKEISCIIIPAGVTVNLNGNGKTISRSTSKGKVPEKYLFSLSKNKDEKGNNKPAKLNINGKLTLNGNGKSSTAAIYIAKLNTVDINGTLTINNNISIGNGGGIHNEGTLKVTDGGSLAINSCKSTGNGGGIANYGTFGLKKATVNIYACVASNGNGGGIFNSGSVETQNENLNEFIIRYCKANRSSKDTGDGGGIASSGGSISFNAPGRTSAGNQRVRIYSNSANGTGAEGGAIHCNDGAKIYAKSVLLAWNTSSEEGGAIFASDSKTQVTLGDFSIHNNKATGGSGGGIGVYYNATFSNYNTPYGSYPDGSICNNTASASGGGIRCGGKESPRGGNLYLDNCHIYNNTANTSGGGISYGDIVSGTKNMEITNCLIYNNACTNHGGGIEIEPNNGTPGKAKISGCKIHDNKAGSNGGGIWTSHGKATITKTDIYSNYVGQKSGSKSKNGGGIFNDEHGSLTVSGSKIYSHGNLSACASSGVGNGGGVFNNKGTVTIQDTEIYGNGVSGDGAGVYNNGTAKIESVNIYNCKAARDGGGIYNLYSLTATSVNLTKIIANEKYCNIAKNGGGVANYGYAILQNCQLKHNQASASGGAILNGNNGALSATGCTVQYNEAGIYGGGLSSASTRIVGGSDIYNCKMDGCTISGNDAESGTQIYNISTGTYINNSKVINKDGGTTSVENNGVMSVDGGSLNGNKCDNVLNDSNGELTISRQTKVTNSITALKNAGKVHFKGCEMNENTNFIINNGSIDSSGDGLVIEAGDAETCIANNSAATFVVTDGTFSITNNSTKACSIENSGSFESKITGAGFSIVENSEKTEVEGDKYKSAINNSNKLILNGGYIYATKTVNYAIYNTNTSSGNVKINGVYIGENAKDEIHNYNFTRGIFNKNQESNIAAIGKNVDGTLTSIYADTCGIENNGMIVLVEANIQTADSFSEIRINTAGITNYEGGVVSNFKGYVKHCEKGIVNAGTFTMSGGNVFKNNVGVTNDYTFCGNGGSVSNNKNLNGKVNKGFGSGIYNEEGTLSLAGVSIKNNRADYGAGIYNAATVRIVRAKIFENTAKADGGGIYNTSYIALETNNALISDNEAKNGAGVYNTGDIDISGTAIKRNVASSSGGGIYNAGSMNYSAGSINENNAQKGAGIYLSKGSELSQTGGKITDNQADKGVGVYYSKDAIYAVSNDASCHNNIFEENGAYIRIPSDFSNSNNNQFFVTTEADGKDKKGTEDVGRIIANYEGDITSDTKMVRGTVYRGGYGTEPEKVEVDNPTAIKIHKNNGMTAVAITITDKDGNSSGAYHQFSGESEYTFTQDDFTSVNAINIKDAKSFWIGFTGYTGNISYTVMQSIPDSETDVEKRRLSGQSALYIYGNPDEDATGHETSGVATIEYNGPGTEVPYKIDLQTASQLIIKNISSNDNPNLVVDFYDSNDNQIYRFSDRITDEYVNSDLNGYAYALVRFSGTYKWDYTVREESVKKRFVYVDNEGKNDTFVVRSGDTLKQAGVDKLFTDVDESYNSNENRGKSSETVYATGYNGTATIYLSKKKKVKYNRNISTGTIEEGTMPSDGYMFWQEDYTISDKIPIHSEETFQYWSLKATGNINNQEIKYMNPTNGGKYESSIYVYNDEDFNASDIINLYAIWKDTPVYITLQYYVKDKNGNYQLKSTKTSKKTYSAGVQLSAQDVYNDEGISYDVEGVLYHDGSIDSFNNGETVKRGSKDSDGNITYAENTVKKYESGEANPNIIKFYTDRYKHKITVNAKEGIKSVLLKQKGESLQTAKTVTEEVYASTEEEGGTSFTIDATVMSGYEFRQWKEGSEVYTTDKQSSVTVTDRDIILDAYAKMGNAEITVKHYLMDEEGQYPEEPALTESIYSDSWQQGETFATYMVMKKEFITGDNEGVYRYTGKDDEIINSTTNEVYKSSGKKNKDGYYIVSCTLGKAQEVRVYYERIPYEITLHTTSGIDTVDFPELTYSKDGLPINKTFSGSKGDKITAIVYSGKKVDIKAVCKDNYKFVCWADKENISDLTDEEIAEKYDTLAKSSVVMGKKNIELWAFAVRGNADIIVNYYKMDRTGSYPSTPTSTETFSSAVKQGNNFVISDFITFTATDIFSIDNKKTVLTLKNEDDKTINSYSGDGAYATHPASRTNIIDIYIERKTFTYTFSGDDGIKSVMVGEENDKVIKKTVYGFEIEKSKEEETSSLNAISSQKDIDVSKYDFFEVELAGDSVDYNAVPHVSIDGVKVAYTYGDKLDVTDADSLNIWFAYEYGKPVTFKYALTKIDAESEDFDISGEVKEMYNWSEWDVLHDDKTEQVDTVRSTIISTNQLIKKDININSDLTFVATTNAEATAEIEALHYQRTTDSNGAGEYELKDKETIGPLIPKKSSVLVSDYVKNYEEYKLTSVVVDGETYSPEEIDGLEYTPATATTANISYYYDKVIKPTVRIYAEPTIGTISVNGVKYNVEEKNEGDRTKEVAILKDVETGESVDFYVTFNKAPEGYKIVDRKYCLEAPLDTGEETEWTELGSDFTYVVNNEDVKDNVINIYISADTAPIEYDIVYNMNLPEGVEHYTGEMEDTHMKYDEYKALSASNFFAQHHAFVGWSLTPRGTDVVFDDKEIVHNLTSKDGDKVNLYAVWVKNIDQNGIYVTDKYFNVNTPISFNDLFWDTIVTDHNGTKVDIGSSNFGIYNIREVITDGEYSDIYLGDEHGNQTLDREKIKDTLKSDYETKYEVTVKAIVRGRLSSATFNVTIWDVHSIASYVRAIDSKSLRSIAVDSKWASGKLNAELISTLNKNSESNAKYTYKLTYSAINNIRKQYQNNGYSWVNIKSWFRSNITPTKHPDNYELNRNNY